MDNYYSTEKKNDFMSTLCCKHWINQMTSDCNGVSEENYKYRDNGYYTSPVSEDECAVCNYHIKQASETIGFIIMDGNGALFAQLLKGQKRIILEFTNELLRKMGRGGISATRFARLRLEKRQQFINKVIIESNKYFYNDGIPNVSKIVIGCSAEFKNKMSEIKSIGDKLTIHKIVDIPYGGCNGLNNAIEAFNDI